jgi:L-alanine-DL-glutamate epimerase-like enolase superfamily enzyme
MQHKIKSVNVHLVSLPLKNAVADSWRRVESVGYTIVRIATDQGLEGHAVTYRDGSGGHAIRSLVNHGIAPRLIGRNPLETEVIWQELVQCFRGIGRKGLTFCALSVIDIALWDLKGKILGLPLYRLLGGNNPKVPVYASGGWTSHSDDALVAEARGMVGQGYGTIKIKVGVEGGDNPKRDIRRVHMVREAIGPDVALLLDANNCWDTATGVRFANSVRDCDIFFLEEPVIADDIPGLARFKRGTDVPLATGEHEYTKYGVRDLVLAEAADVIQVDATRTGGITEVLKIAAIIQAWNLKFAPHSMPYMHMHLVAALPNSLFVESLNLYEGLTAHVYRNAPVPSGSYLQIPDLPGLGLELNMDFIKDQDGGGVTAGMP